MAYNINKKFIPFLFHYIMRVKVFILLLLLLSPYHTTISAGNVQSIVFTMKECGITPYAGTQHEVACDTNRNSFMAGNYHPNGSRNEKVECFVASKLRCFFHNGLFVLGK